MEEKINLNSVCVHSRNVVARDIQGEFIIVPVTSGIEDLDDKVFTLNRTGQLIWGELDGKKSLKTVAGRLTSQLAASREEIEKDVLGLSRELFERKLLVEV